MPFHPVLVTGDLIQAFLQVRIKKEETAASLGFLGTKGKTG